VAKERSDPSVLPGIEAIIPGTPLIQLLNRPDCTVEGELRVIAGDIGLGEVGKFSPCKLKRVVSRGVRTYAISLAESADGAGEAAKPRQQGKRRITSLERYAAFWSSGYLSPLPAETRHTERLVLAPARSMMMDLAVEAGVTDDDSAIRASMALPPGMDEILRKHFVERTGTE
jgi:hypothetical protein